MAELSSDLNKHLINFKQIYSSFNNNENTIKELSSMLNHLKCVNKNLKENDKKLNEQIKILRQICNDQGRAISQLQDFESKNNTLTKENTSLINSIKNLKEKITLNEIKTDETIQEYVIQHELELNNKEEILRNREKELQEQIEVLQASFDLQIFEKENEKNNLVINYEDQLKNAAVKEQQLNNEIFKLNNQLSSNTAVLQKKILELEQKVKNSERDKSMYNTSQGNFITANNVLRNSANLSNITPNKNEKNLEYSQNCNILKSIEKNTTKKFQFRKSHRSSNEIAETKFLSESFNPFETNKHSNVNNQNNEQIKNVNLNSCDEIHTIKTNLESNVSLHNNSEEMEQNQNSTSKYVFPKIKKRRLYNPKKNDYFD